MSARRSSEWVRLDKVTARLLERLRQAEQAVDRPFDREESLEIDSRIVELGDRAGGAEVSVAPHSGRILTLGEVLASMPSVEQQLEGELWAFDKESLTLTAAKSPPAPYEYEFDLEEFTSSAAILDAIMQVAGKSWATDSLLASLVRCADLLLNPQATLCSFGEERGPIDPRRVITGRLGAHLRFRKSAAPAGEAS